VLSLFVKVVALFRRLCISISFIKSLDVSHFIFVIVPSVLGSLVTPTPLPSL